MGFLLFQSSFYLLACLLHINLLQGAIASSLPTVEVRFKTELFIQLYNSEPHYLR